MLYINSLALWGGWEVRGGSEIFRIKLACGAAALHSMLFSLPHDDHVSCEAGSQLCFLLQSSFMWSLPHVLPVPLHSVDSENGGGAPCGGLGRRETGLFHISVYTHNSNTIVSGCCLFSRLITFLSAKKKFVHVDCLLQNCVVILFKFS